MKKCAIFILLAIFCLFLSPAAWAIKIGLYTQTKDTIYVGVSKGGVIQNSKTSAYILVLNKMKPYKLKKMGKYILITVDNKDYRIGAKEIRIKSTRKDGLVFSKRRWYKGDLVVLNTKKGLTVINDVDMESYIKGVVPAEMPVSWNTEAHKAQAIAARSYAMANSGKRLEYGYDLKDTPLDQNYMGASIETVKTNKAVDATRGQVLVHDGKIIPAYYCASAGGSTLSARKVWGNDLPYIKPVKSFDSKIPRNGHRVGMSQHGANILANKGYSAYQILGYFYKNVALRRL